ncbi:MAG: hypothetical protein QY309_09235 [Cyclobacteriaceae bacterium]|nr:MAG: hypothetical protein QY309_09235 [Cyclobacteriaceae bacterium]
MNNFKIVISAIVLLAAISARSQSMQRDSLVGVWICVEATIPDGLNISAEEMEAINVFKSALVKSKFLFKTNGLFEWQFQKGTPAMFQELSFLNNQKWSIDTKGDLIHIGDPKENLMQVRIREKAGIVYFILSDTPLLLRMKKE